MTDDVNGMRALEAMAEAAYDAMYEAHSKSGAGVCYSDAKDYFREAIAVAGRLGATEDVVRLEARLLHVKAVFRSQFT
ncbi:MAG: hypothetical protein SGJ03_16155 [Alphaproteobacteria bacterium]|nr:hypothetical protein [Alphaproteobacteria bacterium]